jgi:hypothetical protein
MSFFSDLFEGNTSQLGGDLTSPTAISEYEDAGIAAGGLALGALGLGELGVFGGLGGEAAAGGGLAADLGLGDIGAAAAADAGGGLAADVGAGAGLGELGDLSLAADAGLGDVGAAGVGDAAAISGDIGAGASDVASGLGDTSGLLNYDSSGLLSQDAGAAAPSIDATSGVSTASPGVSDTSGMLTPQQQGLIQGETNASVNTLNDINTSIAGYNPPGFTDQVSGFLSSPYTRIAAGVAPLALALGMGQPSLGSAGQQSQAYANQLAAYGQQQLALGTSGQLTPAQGAAITKMQSDLTNQWLQTLANQGVQDPTKDARWPQILATIDTQVTAATQTMLQQTIQNGLTALGQGGTQLAAISQQQMTADQNFTNTLVNATRALGTAVAGGSTFKVTAA